MTQHEENILKLVDFIAATENTKKHLTCKQSLAKLNGLVLAHSIVTGTEYFEYDQLPDEPPKDYVG